MKARVHRPDPRRAGRGFTLIELLISLAVMAIVVVGVLMLFDFNNKLARAQTHVAEMQQSLRVSQLALTRNIRMAGRGKLPAGQVVPTFEVPNIGTVEGIAVAVRDDVGGEDSDWPSADIAIGFDGSPQVVPGTDVLVVRGVFNAPLYQINHTAATFTFDGTDGSVLVPDVSHTGVRQPTAALIQSIGDGSDDNPGVPETILLTSPLDDAIFAFVELDRENAVGDDPTNVQLAFKYDEGAHTARYRDVMESIRGVEDFPGALQSVSFIGILEEYRFYVRQDGERPHLAMARMVPFTEVPYGGNVANARIDVADNIVDLQITLGVDLDGDGEVPQQVEYDDRDTDEWLYNHDADDTEPETWNGRRLFYVKLSTLGRTERRDWNYLAPRIVRIENHPYDEVADPPEDERRERLFHRRLLETIVDMRNLS
jgi:prepilin-type N-terminal cleavage/methylation domain-containing protein